VEEVLPGIWDWQAFYAKIGLPVHSHAVDGTLIDPMLPEGGVEALRRLEPERVLLTNRHHDREATEIGLPVLCPAVGLHEFEGRELSPDGYGHGEEVAPGIHAHGVLESWPDETALHVPAAGLVIVADSVMRGRKGELGFFPDQYLGDDPEEEKAAIRAGWRNLLELDFDNLLFAHGPPWIGGAKAALREFLEA
jgi:hypothetical protein